MSSFDPHALDQQLGTALAAVAYRNQAAGFDPRSGEGARRFGGRFNPPNSFAVLYLCTTRACVVAELTRQAARQSLSVEDLLPRELWRIRANLATVLDLTDASTLAKLGVHSGDLVRDDHHSTQELGATAHAHKFQAILAPSATGVDAVLAIFPDNLGEITLNVERIAEWINLADIT
jgi:RES domain-containing protein